MRQILSPVEDLVAVEVRDPAPDDPSITIEERRVVISLADVASVTLDRDAADATERLDLFAGDLLVALAVGLSFVGQANIAAQVGSTAGHLSRIFGDLNVAMEIAGAMLRSQRLGDAIRLADALDESGVEDLRFAAFVLLGALLGSRRQLQPMEQQLALDSAKRRVDRRRASSDANGVAAESYNLAMLFKRARNASEAVHWFREAAKNDPTYLDRAYYHSDLAGALFEFGVYGEAVHHYRIAVDTGDRASDQALLADSLLYAGRYEEARAEFAAYVAEASGHDAAEWRLKAQTVQLLIDTVGPQQERDPEAADELLGTWSFESNPGPSIEEAWRSCQEAIALDACCGEAWFRLAFFTIGQADSALAGGPYSRAAAVLSRYAPGMWRNALLCTDPLDARTIGDIFSAGYHLSGPSFIEDTIEAIDGAPHLEEHRARLIDLLDEAVAAHQQTGSERVMRIPGADGRMREIVFTDGSGLPARKSPEDRPSWRPPPLQPPASARRRSRSRRTKAGKTHGRQKRRRRSR